MDAEFVIVQNAFCGSCGHTYRAQTLDNLQNEAERHRCRKDKPFESMDNGKVLDLAKAWERRAQRRWGSSSA